MYVVMVSNKVRLNLPEQLGCNRCPYMIARSTDSRNITGNNLSFDKILAFWWVDVLYFLYVFLGVISSDKTTP